MSQNDVVVLSGGMDSTVLAYQLASTADRLVAVSFDYGQRHAKELFYASATATKLGIEHNVIDLHGLRALLKGSALTDFDVDVPHGHYADDNMRVTVVPNRNMIMLSIAVGVAVAERCSRACIAVHAGDHAVYPDCRPDFIAAAARAAVLGNAGFTEPDFDVWAPYVRLSKTDIARLGDAYDVPWADTWSCYEGLAVHCGKCGTCVERREAFELAGVDDPTEYAG